MTNKEDERAKYDPGMTALLAVHLVSQVLDEAYVIANTAKETGQTWRYDTLMRNIECHGVDKTVEDISAVSKGDTNVNENKIDALANVVATSTPQKILVETKVKIGSANIGQGDEEREIALYEPDNFTPIFIRDIFNMSDVQQAILCQDSEMIENNAKPNDFNDGTKTWDSHNNTAFNLAHQLSLQSRKISDSSQSSDFSFLSDAFINDIAKGEGLNVINDANPLNTDNILEVTETLQIFEETVTEIQKKDTELNENIYLTLNQDDEQYSDEDGELVLQDPKGMILLDVELRTANTSDGNILPSIKPDQANNNKPEKQSSTTVISSNSSRKNSLVRRCRNQGARLLSCLRGWWQSKSTKRKEVRDSLQGIGRLSPDLKRRADSLDQRLLRSRSPSNNVTWKFNTINEVAVRSNRWNTDGFD